MDLNEYQRLASMTAIYENAVDKRYKCGCTECNKLKDNEKIMYSLLGISSEVGELHGKIKKYIRGDKEHSSLVVDIKKELGDILWYLSDICRRYGFSLENVARENIEKLFYRMERGIIKGDGDNR